MSQVLIGIALIAFGLALLVLVGVALMVPAATEASERLRIQRETQDAAWEIHKRSASAFGEMLQAARSDERRPKHPRDDRS